MKKILVSMIIFLFILQGMINISAYSSEDKYQKEALEFSMPTLVVENECSVIEINDADQYARYPGESLRPMIIRSYSYPFGTIIEDIKVEFSNPQTITLTKPLARKASPQTIYQGSTISMPLQEPGSILDESYQYTIDTGIKDGQHVVYLNLYISPVSYELDSQKTIMYTVADITIERTLPKNPVSFPDEYDMVIIAPESFSNNIQPLIEHKNSIGIETFFKSCENIYDSYSGIDDAEKIKYFIKDAIESYGIEYVLLVGGRNGGIFEEKWHVPVRYTNLNDGAESSFISDLYYADIYNETGAFATWDTDGNGVFAEWNLFRKDNLGLIPDVYLGRIPCGNAKEVTIMVDKIITYETINKESWFYDMVVVGGDSAHVEGDIYYEGEEENKQALLYMKNFTGSHCWTSDQTFTGKEDVMDAISEGCGFLFFDGHASVAKWSTHPPRDTNIWIEGPDVFDMKDLQNGDKFSVCVVGGCHIAQFNVSLHNIVRDIIKYGIKGYFFEAPFKFYYLEWVPKCWSWQLASMKEGGSIATLGYTGLDWFAIGDYNEDGIPDCTQFYSGFMNTHFFKNYGENNIHILGQAHTQTIIDFINTHPPMNYELDCKTVEEFVLLGDPSLHMVASL